MSLQTEIEDAFASNDFEKVKNKLQTAIDLYYVKGDSPLSDSQYDNYLDTYIDLTGDESFRDAKVSKAMLKKVRTANVNFPELCAWLTKSNSINDTEKWFTKTKHNSNDAMVVSFKYDGLSIVHEYSLQGKLQYAVTRGDDNLAVDYTSTFEEDTDSYFAAEEIFDIIINEYESDNTCTKFAIKYEAVISYDNLDKINKKFNREYKNPRNTVAALFRRDDSKEYRKYITLVPLDIQFENNDILNALPKSERINIIERLINSKTNNKLNLDFDWWLWDGVDEDLQFNSITELDGYLNTLTTEYREHCPYMLDGIVIEYNDPDKVEELGGFNETPPHVLGWKFPTQKYQTKVVSCDWDYGRTGRRTPVINFEPIVINGNTYKRTSISNLLRFDNLQLRPGSPIIFELRGEVLGYIKKDTTKPDSTEELFTLPHDIIEITYNDNNERVYAYSEASIADRVERFFINANVKGIKSGTIDAIINGFYKSNISPETIPEFLAECFDNPIETYENMGNAKASYFLETIDAKNEEGIQSWEVLAGLNIQSIGVDTAKKIMFNTQHTLYGILKICEEDGDELKQLKSELISVQGLGKGRVENALSGILKYALDIYNFYDIMNILDDKPVILSSEEQLTIVVTGDLQNWPDRAEFKILLESMGHKLTTSISGKTDYLVTNNPRSGTVKIKKAREKGVNIVTELEICEILGLNKSLPQQKNSQSAESIDEFF